MLAYQLRHAQLCHRSIINNGQLTKPKLSRPLIKILIQLTLLIVRNRETVFLQFRILGILFQHLSTLT